MKKSIIILGSTASGKTKLSLEIAKNFNLNIVNSDSRQFWQEIKCLSCSPSVEDLIYPSFLFNILESEIKPSLGWWKNEIKNIDNKLIVGGNGFYILSLQSGIPENVIISKETREKILKIENPFEFLQNNGINLVFHENDKYRLNRKLEFFLETGFDFENFPNKYKEKLFIIVLEPDLDILEQNIEKRTNNFIDKAIEEVKNSSKHNNLYDIIGFKEILEFLENKMTKNDLMNQINRQTLKYAKHQRKFLKNPNLIIDIKMKNDRDLDKVLQKISIFLKN